MKATSKLAQTLSAGRFALLAECLPPRSADPDAVKKVAAALPRVLDAVVVAESQGDVRSSPLACAALLSAEKVECVLSLVTRDRNRIALESDVLGAAALGVQGFLCMTGVHQALGLSPKAAGAYDIDSVQLAQAITQMAEAGIGFGGDKLGRTPSLFALTVAHPALRPLALNLVGLAKKAAAGARAVLTDAVTDLPAFEQWMDAVRKTGLDEKIAIIASVKLDTATAVSLAQKLKSVPGVRGIHILSGGRESDVSGFLSSTGLA
jgi:methylenetetrahydrofolate reductase (NADPH)